MVKGIYQGKFQDSEAPLKTFLNSRVNLRQWGGEIP